MSQESMQETLDAIRDLYVSEIRATLASLKPRAPLYAAFIPYFAWGGTPEVHSQLGMELSLLDVEYLKSASGSSSNPNEISYRAYSWGEFMGGKIVPIDSPLLQKALLQWYRYQAENVSRTDLLERLGQTLAEVCVQLNRDPWEGMKYTSDFVVFTDCTADETPGIGIRESVPAEWLAQKQAAGMLHWWNDESSN